MPASKHKAITDANIALRSASPEDAELIASWLAQADVSQYLSSRLRDRFISAQLISVTLRRPDQAWMMIELNGEAIGFQVLDDFDQADAIANLWYCLGALSWRGFGIMPLSIKKLTDSPPLSLRVISAWVGSINTASIRCLEKAEFREVGRIKNAFNVNGLHDRVIFEKQINVNDK